MALSTQRAVSDGTLTQLILSINYFDRTEIEVYFAGILTPSSSGKWVWVGTTDKKIAFTPAVANGVEVMVKRSTAMVDPRHEYTKGAQFVAETLDDNFTQMLRIAQEAKEGSTLTEIFNDLDLHGFKIKSLGAATLPGDAVPLSQYQADANGAFASKTAAASSASAAATSATAAAGSATAAATSASNAASSATAAGTSATAAATSKTNADAARDAAIAARDAAIAVYGSFDDRYLGAFAAPPTLDNDGNALMVGALYWDTALNALRVRNSSAAWVTPISSVGSTISRTSVISTDNQRTFAITYPVGLILVLVRGTVLPTADYDASNGTSVVLNTGLPAGTEVEFIVISMMDLVNAVPSTGGTMTGPLNVPAGATGTQVPRANEVCQRASILGTVSQSAGVPTGALMEYISNANGECWKYAGGMQICKRIVTPVSRAITTAYGSSYIFSAPAWTFPAAFVGDAPAVSGGFVSSGGGVPSLSITAATLTTASYYITHPNSQTLTIGESLIAIGRWF